jgi:hypothetical protein
MALKHTHSYLEDSIALLRYYKRLAEGAMAQLSDQQLLETLDPEMNSIALIVKHMAGNMLSRWSDFLVSDGEKPWRNRDDEFEAPPSTRAEIEELWERGWSAVFGAIEPLTEEDLGRTITIRGEAHTVMQAINRQVAHYPYHVGQIVFWAKHLKSEAWQSLSVPRKGSREFNAKVLAGEASER